MRRAGTVLLNDSLLLLTAVIWGLAFVAQRMGMESVGPFTYNAVRFALGSLVLLPVILLRSSSPRRGPRDGAAPPGRVGALAAGLIAGAVLVFGASLQQVGLVTTTAGKAGFITGFYVVLVPLVGLLWGQRTEWTAWTGAVLCLGGLFLLSVTSSLTLAPGDLLVLIGSLFWTAHVQVVGWLSPRTDPVRLACVQFAVCSLCSAGVALAVERPSAPSVLAAAGPILYGGVLSVGVAYTLQVVAQRRAPPAHAAILLSLESVFAAIGGGILLGERLGTREAFGCALMFVGMIVSQAPLLVDRSRAASGAHRRHAAPSVMDSHFSRTVLEVLRSLPGVKRAEEVPPDLRRRVADLEDGLERAPAIPVRNLGLQLIRGRDACFVILKDGSFRLPGAPTVCLVEENAPPGCAHPLVVGETRYAIVGEEAAGGTGAEASAGAEAAILLERSFVIYPERRRGPDVPCLFVLPPVHFPELDGLMAGRGVRDAVSVSPSPAADELLRKAFGFPPTRDLATLLVGCDRAAGTERPGPGAAPKDGKSG